MKYFHVGFFANIKTFATATPFYQWRMVHIPPKPVWPVISQEMVYYSQHRNIYIYMWTKQHWQSWQWSLWLDDDDADLTDPASRKAKPHCMKKMTIALEIHCCWCFHIIVTFIMLIVDSHRNSPWEDDQSLLHDYCTEVILCKQSKVTLITGTLWNIYEF